MKKLSLITGVLLALWYCSVFAGGPEQAVIPDGAKTADTWLHYLQNKLFYEHGWGAIVGGLGVSWVLTHLLKMSAPVEWTERKRQWRIKWTAFWTGFVTTGLMWPLTFEVSSLNGQQLYAMFVTGVVVGVVVGGVSPFAYKLVIGAFVNQLVKRGFLQPEQVSAEANAEVRRQAASSGP